MGLRPKVSGKVEKGFRELAMKKFGMLRGL